MLFEFGIFLLTVYLAVAVLAHEEETTTSGRSNLLFNTTANDTTNALGPYGTATPIFRVVSGLHTLGFQYAWGASRLAYVRP